MPVDKKIKKLLIANRGEIARRINRACLELGIETVLVVSDPDSDSLAASEVGEVVRLGGSTARDSYLNGAAIIKAGLDTGCDAVHPGYGFLSEDPEFAQAVLDSGMIFVGPSPSSIRALGVKTTARATVAAAGVPVTPGSVGGASDDELRVAAQSIGLPVIIKAAAGGGGRGMRIIRSLDDLAEGLTRARAEALKNFGSEAVYLERYIEEPRHVEVQLFGDTHGNIIHFGTRDCSSQRRHQKLVEEAPAPFLDEQTRAKIHAAAVAAARSVGYYNAGTAEFLVKDSEFFFLEINTRIQVEHPVTEAITGVDLVVLQLKVAMGEPLPLKQEQVVFNGHAIELRINAEDVCENFRPAVGLIEGWVRDYLSEVNLPSGCYAREDSGYREGDTISPFYDSLISKLIVFAPTRAEAIYHTYQILKRYSVAGVPTTIPFHAWILANVEFQQNGIDIGYVERTFSEQAAKEALSLLADDSSHRSLQSGEQPFDELVDFPDSESGQATKIKIVHEPGGTFLAIPLNRDGSQRTPENWRRSNSRDALINALGTI